MTTMRRGSRGAYRTDALPDDLADDILSGMAELAEPALDRRDDDLVIDG